MTTRNIVVLPYDEKWAQAFLDIKSELDAVGCQFLLNMLGVPRFRDLLQNQLLILMLLCEELMLVLQSKRWQQSVMNTKVTVELKIVKCLSILAKKI